MSKYKVTFYQCGVYGIDPEYYNNLASARQAACSFLAAMLPMPGHKRVASVYRDRYARIVDYRGGTEAMAEIHDNE